MTNLNKENIKKSLNIFNIDFKNDVKQDDLKAMFRKLSNVNHPDKGGDVEKMKEINWAYDFLSENFEEIFMNDLEIDDENLNLSLSIKGLAILEVLKTLEGLIIDVVGCWIWVDGETKQHKEKLKELNLRWNSKKLKWFFAGSKTRSRSNMNYDQIKSVHGSKSFHAKESKKPNKLN